VEELEAGGIKGGGVFLATEVFDDDFFILILKVPLVITRLGIAVDVRM